MRFGEEQEGFLRRDNDCLNFLKINFSSEYGMKGIPTKVSYCIYNVMTASGWKFDMQDRNALCALCNVGRNLRLTNKSKIESSS